MSLKVIQWSTGNVDRKPALIVEHVTRLDAAHRVNAIPAVCAARSGLMSALDLPMITGKGLYKP